MVFPKVYSPASHQELVSASGLLEDLPEGCLFLDLCGGPGAWSQFLLAKGLAGFGLTLRSGQGTEEDWQASWGKTLTRQRATHARRIHHFGACCKTWIPEFQSDQGVAWWSFVSSFPDFLNFGACCQGMLGLENCLPTFRWVFRVKPPKVNLLAGEQKATESTNHSWALHGTRPSWGQMAGKGGVEKKRKS